MRMRRMFSGKFSNSLNFHDLAMGCNVEHDLAMGCNVEHDLAMGCNVEHDLANVEHLWVVM